MDAHVDLPASQGVHREGKSAGSQGETLQSWRDSAWAPTVWNLKAWKHPQSWNTKPRDQAWPLPTWVDGGRQPKPDVPFFPYACRSYQLIEPRGKDRVRKTHGCFLYEIIIQLHHFSLPIPPYNLIHIPFLDSFKSTVSLLWVYTYIPKYNQFSLCNVICIFSELTIWYWTVSSCICPQRKLFLLL